MPGGAPTPFFLDEAAFGQLEGFVRERPSLEPQLLVLAGPVKSGKTAVLHSVLPSLIADAYRAGKTPRPFILRFSFDLRSRPEAAALALLERAREASAGLGITLSISTDTGWALRHLDWVMTTLARALAEQRGAQLWLLLDECQVS